VYIVDFGVGSKRYAAKKALLVLSMSAKKSAVNTGFLSYRGFLRFPDNLGPF
jgi:hypothetical protein